MKKRTWSLLLVAALLISLVGGALPTNALWVAHEVQGGDVDNDESVTSTDARLLLQYAAGKISEDELDLTWADVDGDETFSSTDARLLLQYAAGKLEKFPHAMYTYSYSEAETTPNPNPDTFADYTAGNPVITSIFTADPSAHVWKDGRMYMYPSHDVFPAAGCDRMDKYHIFSTDNMVDWVDEGEIFSSADVPWSNCPGFMWAPDCCYIEETDTYYYFFPHPLTDDQIPNQDGNNERGWNFTWVMGVAKSVGSPTGPFEQMGFVKLDESLYSEEELTSSGYAAVGKNNMRKSQITGWFNAGSVGHLKARDGKTLSDHGVSGAAVGGYSLIDPCPFVDTDGQVYLYYGGGGRCFVVKLGEDMLTATTAPKAVTGLPDFHEGSFVFRHPDNGMYYNLYADNAYDLDGDGNNEGNQMRYSYAFDPMGPFYEGGVVLKPTGCDTSHGSIAQYKGNWYLFYHNKELSNQGNLRSVCVDQLFFDEENLRIQTVTQTDTGVKAVGPAYQGEGVEDKYSPAGIDISRYTVKTDYDLSHCTVGGGASMGSMVQNMHIADSWAKFSGIDGGKGGRAVLTVQYATPDGAASKVMTESELCIDGYFLKMDATGGWSPCKGVAHCFIDLKPGENVITLLGGSGFNMQSITVSLLPENAN